jgi:hypothetical protein
MTNYGKSASDQWLDDMEEMEGQYGKEAEERPEREEVPDGNYQVQVEKVEVVKAKTSGNTMLRWTLRIIAPTCIGRKLFKNHVFTPNCLGYIKQDLGLCGFDHANFRNLPNHLGDFLDLQLEVAKRQNERPDNGDRRRAGYNLYFNRLIGRGAPGDRGTSNQGHLSAF